MGRATKATNRTVPCKVHGCCSLPCSEFAALTVIVSGAAAEQTTVALLSNGTANFGASAFGISSDGSRRPLHH